MLSLPSIAQRTTRMKLKPISTEIKHSDTIKTHLDTIVPEEDMIILSGYDKTRKSRKESFFATNSSDKTLKAIQVKFIYYDMDGRMLHQEVHKIDCKIPAGETRQLHVSSWDKQLSFYYCNSSKSSTGIPYDIEYVITMAIYSE